MKSATYTFAKREKPTDLGEGMEHLSQIPYKDSFQKKKKSPTKYQCRIYYRTLLQLDSIRNYSRVYCFKTLESGYSRIWKSVSIASNPDERVTHESILALGARIGILGTVLTWAKIISKQLMVKLIP